MTQFKVGDKVKQTERESPYGRCRGYDGQATVYLGDYVGTVAEVSEDPEASYPAKVSFPFDGDEEGLWPFRDDELTLVERPAPETEKVYLVIGAEYYDDFIVLDVAYADRDMAVVDVNALNIAKTGGMYWAVQEASVRR